MRRKHKHSRTVSRYASYDPSADEASDWEDDVGTGRVSVRSTGLSPMPRLPEMVRTDSGKYESVAEQAMGVGEKTVMVYDHDESENEEPLSDLSETDETSLKKPAWSDQQRLSQSEPEFDIARVLILGPERTGKTAVFEQMRHFCGDHELTESELSETKRRIVVQICSIVKDVVLESIRLGASEMYSKCRIAKENEWAVQRIIHMLPSAAESTDSYHSTISLSKQKELMKRLEDESVFIDVRELLTVLLTDKGVSHTCGFLKSKHLFDKVTCINGLFLLSRFRSYFNPEYQCDFSDVLRTYNARGIYDEVCSLSREWKLHLTDLPGSRDRRSLWCSVMHPHYTVIVYVVSLSDYCEWKEIPVSTSSSSSTLISGMGISSGSDAMPAVSDRPRMDRSARMRTMSDIPIMRTKDIMGGAPPSSSLSSSSLGSRSGDGETLRTNRLLDSLELLANLSRLSFFTNTKLVLLLNKQDLFEENLRNGVAFSSHCKYEDIVELLHKGIGIHKSEIPQFDTVRSLDFDYIVDYIKALFTCVLPEHQRKTMSIYVTCAIAADTFGFVLRTMTQEIKHTEQMRMAMR